MASVTRRVSEGPSVARRAAKTRPDQPVIIPKTAHTSAGRLERPPSLTRRVTKDRAGG